MAMYANIDGTNKLLAQTAAEMTAAGGGGWQSQSVTFRSIDAVDKSFTIPYENYILAFSHPNSFIGFITKSTMFVCSVGLNDETTTTFKLSTIKATTSISSTRHYYYGNTKKYTYVYLTTTGIKFVKQSNGGDTYTNITAIFYYKELK